MYNFHYPKIIASVGSSLAKETVLSKIMNFVDGFSINLSQGFDDRQKKYIDTILKLDNSKSIMLETKGGGVSVKNVKEFTVGKGTTVSVDFSEYLEDSEDVLYIDYPNLHNVSVGAVLTFSGSNVELQVEEVSESGGISCSVIQEGVVLPNKSVYFKNFDAQLSFLNQKDKKDIQWGLQGGIHIMVGSFASSTNDLKEMNQYLDEQRSGSKKIFARVESQEAIENYDDILSYADGVILIRNSLKRYVDDATIRKMIVSAKETGKPIFVTVHFQDDIVSQKDGGKSLIGDFVSMGVDAYMLGEETATGEEPLEVINQLHELLSSLVPQEKLMPIKPFYKESSRDVIDYILYNVYRVVEDLSIRAIVCYTNTGYTAARLASFRPTIPVIAFTKADDSYRYINLLRGVKGYKISQGFDYDNLKKIGKEMIRMMFKGSISLDEKIIIVQVNESVTDEANMINGIELYRFKDI